MRRTIVLLATVLTASSLGAGTAIGYTDAAEERPTLYSDGWCSEKAPPCVVSASRNGAAVSPTDPAWTVGVTASTVGGSRNVSWAVTSTSGGSELGPAALSDTWAITVRTGTVVPRVFFAYGKNVSVTRTPLGGGAYQVSFTGRPTTITDNDECDTGVWPWTCPETAGDETTAYYGGEITDYGEWENVGQREAMYGMNYVTNIGVTSIPPEIRYDSATNTQQLLIRMANQHYRPGGEVFKGYANLRIPNRFLRLAYSVDDPASMTSAGLTATVGTGSVLVYQESGDDAMRVDATGITFSARQLRVRQGRITPTRPPTVTAVRTGDRKARITFAKGTSRGSKVTRHQARCGKGPSARFATSKTRRIVVKGLTPGVAYTCRVRADSKAGYSRWSIREGIKARP